MSENFLPEENNSCCHPVRLRRRNKSVCFRFTLSKPSCHIRSSQSRPQAATQRKQEPELGGSSLRPRTVRGDDWSSSQTENQWLQLFVLQLKPADLRATTRMQHFLSRHRLAPPPEAFQGVPTLQRQATQKQQQRRTFYSKAFMTF